MPEGGSIGKIENKKIEVCFNKGKERGMYTGIIFLIDFDEENISFKMEKIPSQFYTIDDVIYKLVNEFKGFKNIKPLKGEKVFFKENKLHIPCWDIDKDDAYIDMCINKNKEVTFEVINEGVNQVNF